MTTGKHVNQGCATIKVREASVVARVWRDSHMQRALRGEQKEPRCNVPGLSANDISVERHTSVDSDRRHRPVLQRRLCPGLHSSCH